jgi:hypothetical protein
MNIAVALVGAAALLGIATGEPLVTAVVAVLSLSTYFVAAKLWRSQSDHSQAWQNHSGRQHSEIPTQTWAAFLKETYRKNRNSGAHVKLGGSFEIGIVGESFYLSELRWIRSLNADSSRYRIRFLAYLIPEPENPFSRNGNAVRVESSRGRTIGQCIRFRANQAYRIGAGGRGGAGEGVRGTSNRWDHRLRFLLVTSRNDHHGEQAPAMADHALSAPK